MTGLRSILTGLLANSRPTMIRGLMTDEEWTIFARFLTTPSSRGGRPPKNHRHRLDAILWICRTGAPWRDLPVAFGKWNSVWKQFRRWCESGIWDLLLQALADSGGALDMLQMIDSTVLGSSPRTGACATGCQREKVPGCGDEGHGSVALLCPCAGQGA